MLHGGDIYRNKVKLDFSVNINPLGIPASVKKALTQALEHCERYPDIRAERLMEGLSVMTGADKEHISGGSGASELFLAIVHAVRPRRTVIPVPSFYGYERAAMASGCDILFYEMKEAGEYALEEGIMDCLTGEMELLFLANPNNPVGNLIEGSLLERVVKHCREKGIIAVIDECFLEFSANENRDTFISRIKDYPNVIVVRAFTKIYAIPGVRLGYLICGSKELNNNIKRQLPEWNLSVFAQAAGIAACKEKKYKEETLRLVGEERRYLKTELERSGLRVYSSHTDYLLLKTKLPLYDRLLEKEILIRDCSSFRGLEKGHYRIAVKRHPENEMLVKAVREILEGQA